MLDFVFASLTLISVLLLDYSTLTAADNLRGSDIQHLAEILSDVADARVTNIITKLVLAAAGEPNSTQHLADAYDALDAGSSLRSTSTSSVRKWPVGPPARPTVNKPRDFPTTTTTGPPARPTVKKPRSSPTTTTTTRTTVKTTTSTRVTTPEPSQETTTTTQPDLRGSSNDTIVVTLKKYEDLAEQMKKNSDELVEILRINTAVVVEDLIAIAAALEKNIRDKSDKLAESVRMSATELRDDNVKLADAMENVYSRQGTDDEDIN